MTNSTVQPGMRAVTVSPFTPIAVINGTPIYPLQGGRSGGGIRIVAGDDDGSPDDDLLDEDDDEDSQDDDEGDELPASMRGKPKPKAKPTRRAAAADEDEEDDDEDDEEDGTPGAIRRMEEALGKANKTAARFRRAGKAMERLGIDDLATWLTERGIDPDNGRPFGADVVDPDDGGAEDEEGDLFEEEPAAKPTRKDAAKNDRETIRTIRAAEQRAAARVRAELVPILAQVSATSALREAGFKGDQKKMDKILRLIDPNDLDVIVEDGEFEIDGLDDAIASIRDDFPELFRSDDETPARRRAAAKATPARRVSGARDVDGDGRGRSATARKSGGWMDQIVARMDAQGR